MLCSRATCKRLCIRFHFLSSTVVSEVYRGSTWKITDSTRKIHVSGFCPHFLIGQPFGSIDTVNAERKCTSLDAQLISYVFDHKIGHKSGVTCSHRLKWWVPTSEGKCYSLWTPVHQIAFGTESALSDVLLPTLLPSCLFFETITTNKQALKLAASMLASHSIAFKTD